MSSIFLGAQLRIQVNYVALDHSSNMQSTTLLWSAGSGGYYQHLVSFCSLLHIRWNLDCLDHLYEPSNICWILEVTEV